MTGTASALIGERIRNSRLAQNMSLYELAELSCLSASYLGLIERGRRSVSGETLHNVAQQLSIDVEELLQGIDNQIYQ